MTIHKISEGATYKGVRTPQRTVLQYQWIQLQLLSSKRHGKGQLLEFGRRESHRDDCKALLQRRSQRQEVPTSFSSSLPLISRRDFLIGRTQRAKESFDETPTGQCSQAETRVRRMESDSGTGCSPNLFTYVPVKSAS